MLFYSCTKFKKIIIKYSVKFILIFDVNQNNFIISSRFKPTVYISAVECEKKVISNRSLSVSEIPNSY